MKLYLFLCGILAFGVTLSASSDRSDGFCLYKKARPKSPKDWMKARMRGHADKKRFATFKQIAREMKKGKPVSINVPPQNKCKESDDDTLRDLAKLVNGSETDMFPGWVCAVEWPFDLEGENGKGLLIIRPLRENKNQALNRAETCKRKETGEFDEDEQIRVDAIKAVLAHAAKGLTKNAPFNIKLGSKEERAASPDSIFSHLYEMSIGDETDSFPGWVCEKREGPKEIKRDGSMVPLRDVVTFLPLREREV